MIRKTITDMEKECSAVEKQCFDITYYMKGGMTFDEVWGLSFEQRERYTKDLNKKLRHEAGDTTEFM